MAVTEHICIGPTRWDWLAWKAYGDSTKIAAIADENPNLEVRCLIPAGTRVVVPVIEVQPVDVIGLPPWKQVQTTEGIETAKAASDILNQMLSSQTQTTDAGSFDGSFD
jgi:phage tail protein X